MASYRDLDVTVVYSEGGVAVSRARRTMPVGRVDRRRLLGCLTLLTAAAWLYVTWFPVRHFLGGAYLEAMINLPGLIDLSQVLGFKPAPPELANPAGPTGKEPGESAKAPMEAPAVPAYRSDAEPLPSAADQRAQSQAILGRLAAAKYTWITIMTIVGCWLAMTGAAGVSGWLTDPGRARPARLLAGAMLLIVGLITWWYWPRAGEELRRIPQAAQLAYAAAFALLAWSVCTSSSRAGLVRLFVVGLVVLTVMSALIWRSYHEQFPIRASQTCAFCLMVVLAMLGAALSSHLRGLTAIAIVLARLSCAATVVAMRYAQRSGGFVTYTPTAITYVKAIVLQSLFVWLLLAARVLRR